MRPSTLSTSTTICSSTKHYKTLRGQFSSILHQSHLLSLYFSYRDHGEPFSLPGQCHRLASAPILSPQRRSAQLCRQLAINNLAARHLWRGMCRHLWHHASLHPVDAAYAFQRRVARHVLVRPLRMHPLVL